MSNKNKKINEFDFEKTFTQENFETKKSQWESRIEELELLLARKDSEIINFISVNSKLIDEKIKIIDELNSFKNSSSWKITSPLRFLVNSFIKSCGLVLSFFRNVSRFVLVRILKFIFSIGFLKKFTKLIISKFPFAYMHLRNFYNNRCLAKNTGDLQLCENIEYSDIFTGINTVKKVAVLTTKSSSGVTGGAERFYSGLVKSLQSKGCAVTLVDVLVDESTFEGIQDAYAYFEKLDLNDYDLVISTKAPSYMVKHKNHIIYLVHTVRVFYDMFDHVFPLANQEIKNQQKWIIEKDNIAFSTAKNIFSIGNEVSKRLQRWNNYTAEVLYPAIDIEGIDSGVQGDYFFMPGRLHSWKRVDLAIQAIKQSKLPMQLIISGDGEAEDDLRNLAGNDPRIKFIGRVDDDELKKLYSEALAVPFLPVREDYGYITIEAFTAGKPVITCADSGEPTEFVEHGLTGLVCEPTAQSVCEAFELIWSERENSLNMGLRGLERVRNITWENVAEKLLNTGSTEIESQSIPRLKVAVLDMQPITPAVGGGRLRLLGLYHALGDGIEARYVGTYDWPGEKYRRHNISKNFEEITVPLSAEHHALAEQAAVKAGGKTVIDMLFGQQAHLSPEYIQETLEAVAWADVVVFSHPWVYPLIPKSCLGGKVVVYDSQNVEADLRGQLLDLNNPYEVEVLSQVVKAEEDVSKYANMILACSKEDKERFIERYSLSENKIKIMPNGVFSDVIKPVSDYEKKTARVALNIAQNSFLGFFIGSEYKPNVEAALYIVEKLAGTLPEITFVIVGGVCNCLPKKTPKNVVAVGFVEDHERNQWLSASDFALNPMTLGSGTNIKMFDFMSAGLPVVSTTVGARGISEISKGGLYIFNRSDFTNELSVILKNKVKFIETGLENRRLVIKDFSWEKLSPKLGILIRNSYFLEKGKIIINDSYKEKDREIRVAHLSTLGLKCGIGEYTRKIIQTYQDCGISNYLLYANSSNETPDLSELKIESAKAWYFDNITWSSSRIDESALNKIIEWQVDNLIIQYHFGFFSSEELLRFVSVVKKLDVRVTVIVHNFSNTSIDIFRKLNNMGVILFSHRLTEVAAAQESGIVLDYIPLGIDRVANVVPKDIANKNFDNEALNIITTGFMRRHKGVRFLINAIPYVLNKFPKAHLTIQCALYPSDDSLFELKECKAEVKRLKLKKHVTFYTEFKEQTTILENLKEADIAVLPYEQSNEGGSATASDCLSVGLPLIVSNAEIFDGIRDVVLTCNPEPVSISEAIIKIASSEDCYRNYSLKSIKYANANSCEKIFGALLVKEL